MEGTFRSCMFSGCRKVQVALGTATICCHGLSQLCFFLKANLILFQRTFLCPLQTVILRVLMADMALRPWMDTRWQLLDSPMDGSRGRKEGMKEGGCSQKLTGKRNALILSCQVLPPNSFTISYPCSWCLLSSDHLCSLVFVQAA